MTTLFGWGPMFDTRGPSPFVLKADIQMQMLGVRFERANAVLEAVAKHKAPYVEDDGAIIEDSAFIRQHFERKLGRDLDAGLSLAERGGAWALERLLEDRLTMIVVSERWLHDSNFAKGPALFFADVPEPMREQVMGEARARIRDMHFSQGLGRHSREERMTLAEWDIAAVARALGEKPYLLGRAPTAVDAVAYGVLSAAATQYFDTPLAGLVRTHANLMDFIGRMEARYFSDAIWPAIAA